MWCLPYVVFALLMLGKAAPLLQSASQTQTSAVQFAVDLHSRQWFRSALIYTPIYSQTNTAFSQVRLVAALVFCLELSAWLSRGMKGRGLNLVIRAAPAQSGSG